MKFKTFYNIYSLQRRFVAIIIAVILLFVALLGRVFYLQIITGKHLQVLACEQWLRDLPLSSKRGEIFDANGVSIATTKTTYDVYVRARSVTNSTELAQALHKQLNINYETAYEKVTNKGFSEILIKMQVEENTAKSLTQYKGVYLSQNVQRVYPYSSLFTQVLGYCTIDNYGQAGLENYYDKYLQGVKGKSLTQTNAQGVEIDNSLAYYLPSIPGADLYTTLDVQMQSILEKELTSAYEEYSALAVNGIIIDAETGGIKAMSCMPSFDLNNVPREDLLALQNLTKNTNVVDVYEPGSTFKLITLSAALNEGLTNMDERFYCGGRCTVAGETIKCWKTIGHGSQTLVEAFKNSCNCVFVQLALRLGVDKYYEYLDYFGLGKKTNVDISGESAGILMNKSKVRTVDLARIGFGHAIAVTPLQMASVYSKITTGNATTPHILTSAVSELGTMYERENKKTTINLSRQTIDTINVMLSNNLNSEGNYTFVAGYDVGGKTGTAQKYDANGQIARGKYISSFIGTYPANNPKYVLIICVNEPQGAYYGGVVAKPIGQKVFSQIFSVKAISPENPSGLELQPTIDMPYIVGMSLAEAIAELKKIGLDCLIQGEGEKVVNQLPEQNTKLFVADQVLIVTN